MKTDKWRASSFRGLRVNFEIESIPGVPPPLAAREQDFRRPRSSGSERARTFGFMRDMEDCAGRISARRHARQRDRADDYRLLNETACASRRVRAHKILDAIGDLYLRPFAVANTRLQSGHGLTNSAARDARGRRVLEPEVLYTTKAPRRFHTRCYRPHSEVPKGLSSVERSGISPEFVPRAELGSQPP